MTFLQLLIFTLLIFCVCASQQQTNFFGSQDVFSGYLSESDEYIEAFTLDENHVVISGSIQTIEDHLETEERTGMSYFVQKQIT